MPKYAAFLSYSSRYAPWVEALHRNLEQCLPLAGPGTGLEFVENTSGNVFRIASSNARYMLLSGRWFAASSLAGPWKFFPQSDLPGDFSEIPDDSPKENVKASVAGTEQAEVTM